MMMHRILATCAGLLLLGLQPALARPNAPVAGCSRAFIAGGHPVRARIKCARSLVTRRVPGAIESVVALFADPDPTIRAGAAWALWGAESAEAGRGMLRAALTDAVPSVREAAFENLRYGMLADIRANNDKAIYSAAIAKGLRSSDVHDVSGALAAIPSLENERAEPVLRRYALDARPAVRVAAIRAFENLMYHSAGIEAFLKSRLSDPSAAVREAASEQLQDYR